MWRLLRAETSCHLYWGEAWVPRAEADLAAARAALEAVTGAESAGVEAAPVAVTAVVPDANEGTPSSISPEPTASAAEPGNGGEGRADSSADHSAAVESAGDPMTSSTRSH
jgi:hypothetical protein